MTTPIKTRFAPSPTGYLHLGGARTALYSWAFARHFGGQFVLRIEDTDVERSTTEAVQAILDGMTWLKAMDVNEGPYYQMQRMPRYKTVIAQLLASGAAYHCYCSPAELEAMRELARQRGEPIRYNGLWRPESGKSLPAIPAGVQPVVRLKIPQTGAVSWTDLVKGEISIDNAELDDFIIARADGVPTYNFCVVVDDYDMAITHVIRGDDHINNTPKQMHVFSAMGLPAPQYGHLPMILGPDGDKLSKRHGAVSVMDYDKAGYLPEAMINYLARLGWSHGDDEIFSVENLVQWFDGTHLSKSAAQWDPAKLNWVNAQYLKQTPAARIAAWLYQHAASQGFSAEAVKQIDLHSLIDLYKDRANTMLELAQHLQFAVLAPAFDAALLAQHLAPEHNPAMQALTQSFSELPQWDAATISAAIKATLAQFSLKMPQLAIPLRVLVAGTPQTPSIDKLLAALGKAQVLRRLNHINADAA